MNGSGSSKNIENALILPTIHFQSSKKPRQKRHQTSPQFMNIFDSQFHFPYHQEKNENSIQNFAVSTFTFKIKRHFITDQRSFYKKKI